MNGWRLTSAVSANRKASSAPSASETFLVRAGDRPQQRLEPIHVLADVRVEVAQADAARRDALRANLFLELGIRARGDDRVMQGLQDRRGRLGGGQEAVPGRVLVIDVGRERGGDRNRPANRLVGRASERQQSAVLPQGQRKGGRPRGGLNAA